MPKDLTNQKDVDASLASMQSGGQTLKIEEGKTPLYFMSSKYHDGYIHWVKVGGQIIRVVCGGGIDGKGFAPDSCKICNFMMEEYKRARQLEGSGNAKGAETVKNTTNEMRAKYEAHFIAVKGDMVMVKTEDNKKRYIPDFDDAVLGVLSLTQKQYEDLLGLVGNEKYPFMNGISDILNRVILADKAKRESHGRKQRYATIEFIPSQKQTAKPKVDFKQEDFDLESNFAIDLSGIDKVMELLSSGDDDSVDYESDDVDPMPEKTVKSAPAKAEKPKQKPMDDDFFDEAPEGDYEEEAEPEKPAPKKAAKKKPIEPDEADF